MESLALACKLVESVAHHDLDGEALLVLCAEESEGRLSPPLVSLMETLRAMLAGRGQGPSAEAGAHPAQEIITRRQRDLPLEPVAKAVRVFLNAISAS